MAFHAVFEGLQDWTCENLPDGNHKALEIKPSEHWTVFRSAFQKHLAGEKRLSVYPISRHPSTYQKVRFAALDLDGEDRLADSEKLLDRLEELGVNAYLERSFSGGFHIWIFLAAWIHAGNVHRFLKRLLSEQGVKGEVRPSTNEFTSKIGPGQAPIALPYFGYGGPKGDQCRILDRYSLRPLTAEEFLDHLEFNTDLPVLPVSSPKCTTGRLRTSPHVSTTKVLTMVASWPTVGKGEYHESASGKPKGGRDDAALGHAGELAALGIFGEEALGHLKMWNSRNPEPLQEKALLQKVRYVARKHEVDF